MNAKPVSIAGIARIVSAAALGALLLSALALSIHAAAAAPLPDEPLPAFPVSKPFGNPNDKMVALAAGDMDDNGTLDLIVVNDGQISYVHFNDGQGGFASKQPAPFGGSETRITSVAVGDMDSDGDLDIVAGVARGQSVIYLNHGGVFTAQKPLPFGPAQSAITPTIAVGDVNGDARYDIVVGSFGGQNAVLLNSARGAFYTGTVTSEDCADSRLVTRIRCFGAPDALTRGVALGDVDGDGRLDIVLGNKGQQNRVYFNTTVTLTDTGREGGFFSTQHSSLFGDPNEATRQVAVGDMNGDGALDIIAVYADSSNPHRVYLNDGHGGFSVEQMKIASSGSDDVGQERDELVSVAVGDLDSDNDLDLVVGIGTSGWLGRLYFNNGAASFEAQRFGNLADRAYAVALGDFNGDGFLDVARANQGTQNMILFNSGQGKFTATPISLRTTQVYAVRIGDVDRDGLLDIVTGNSNAQNTVFRNHGPGQFLGHQAHAFGAVAGTISLALADLDRDGYLDIVEGHEGQRSSINFNDGHGYFTDTARSLSFGPAPIRTFSIAVGDVNSDGHPDIVTGNFGGQNTIYLNDSQGAGRFVTETIGCDNHARIRCFGTGTDKTWSVALGDVNGDSALDIVVGNEIQQSLVYLNDGSGRFASNRVRPFGSPVEATYSVAVGDLNGDGAADIVAGNFYGPSRIHLNDGRGNFPPERSTVLSTGDDRTYDVALADMNGDGTLDVIFGIWFQEYLRAYRGSLVYLNDGRGGFSNERVRTFHVGDDYVRSLGVGDLDGDGTPDIVAGMRYQNIEGNQSRHSVVFYRNLIRHAQYLPGAALDVSVEPVCRGGVLPCAAINPLTVPISYTLRGAPGQRAQRIEGWYSLADGKGWRPINTATMTLTPTLLVGEAGRLDWDLAESGIFGRWNDVRVSLRAYPSMRPYTNSVPGPYLWPYAVATTPPFNLVGTQIRVTATVAGKASPAGAFIYRLAPGQITGGKALADSTGQPFRTNELGELVGRSSLTVNQDRLVALWPSAEMAKHTPVRSYYSDLTTERSLPPGLGSPITTTVRITVEHARRLADGAAHRPFMMGLESDQPIVAVAFSLTQSVSTIIHGYLDAPGGQSIRLFTSDARGGARKLDVTFTNAGQNCFRYPTLPVTVTGTITGIFRPEECFQELYGHEVGGVWTLRLVSFGIVQMRPIVFPTSAFGFSMGRPMELPVFPSPGRLQSWRLDLRESPLFLTSARPIPSGLDAQPVPKVLTHDLNVSSGNPLLLFDLDVALEWDASKDERYRTQLEADIKRASELLYDWTNGQAALGLIRVYDDAKRTAGSTGADPWNNAHIRVYATNRLRPNAVMGGIISQPISDPVKSDIRYFPGQVQIGAIWNRFGESTGNLGDDWARALAHELGHYLFFLDDNYLGMKNDTVIPIRDCSGAMGNLYSDDEERGYGEFHAKDSAWDSNCRDTLSNIETGRSDWETIRAFYPWLHAPAAGNAGAYTSSSGALVQPGPSSLPLDVTQVRFASIDASQTVELPYYEIPRQCRDARASRQEHAFLVKAGERGIVDLGAPGRDQILARGAQRGDELCILSADSSTQRCDTIGDRPLNLSMTHYPEWNPDIEITGATSRTLDIQVRQLSEGVRELKARLFPLDGASVRAITLTASARNTERTFTGTFHLDQPVPVGHILVDVDRVLSQESNNRAIVVRDICPEATVDTNLKAIADYTLGGSPAWIWSRGGTANIWSRGGTARIWSRGGTANVLDAHRVPMVSPDGQAILYGDSSRLTDTLVMLQSITSLPLHPDWLKPVGRGYRLSVFDQNGRQPNPQATGLVSASLNIGYLSSDVPEGGRSWIRAYYWNEQTCPNWCLLDAQSDLELGSMSAGVRGPGIYALMSSIELPLQAGWNMFGYPVEVSRTVSEALASIAGGYTTLYSYEASEAANSTTHGWYSFGANEQADWANDLTHLQFGSGYLIHVTRPITLYLAPEAARPDQALPLAPGASGLSFGSPPATYYGVITGAKSISPALPITVTALVNGQVCGLAVAQDRPGIGLSYVLKVAAGPGCGAPGKKVTLRPTDGLTVTAVWNNHQMHPLNLTLADQIIPPARSAVTPGVAPSIRAAAAPTAMPTVTPTLALRLPATPSPGQDCVELVRNGDFEKIAGWTLPLTQSPARILAEPTGGRVLQLGLAPGETPGRAMTGIASAYQRLRIPTDVRTVKLSFRYRTNFVPGAVGRVVLLLDSGNTSGLWRTTAQSRDWQDATVDLTSYRGREIRLYYEVSPGLRAGMTVDNVSIQTCQ